jgi:hypothetical protein
MEMRSREGGPLKSARNPREIRKKSAEVLIEKRKITTNVILFPNSSTNLI